MAVHSEKDAERGAITAELIKRVLHVAAHCTAEEVALARAEAELQTKTESQRQLISAAWDCMVTGIAIRERSAKK